MSSERHNYIGVLLSKHEDRGKEVRLTRRLLKIYVDMKEN